MATNSGQKSGEDKRVLPRKPEELLAIERRLGNLSRVFADMQHQMAKEGLPTVDLATGTFEFYLGKLEGLAAKFQGRLNSQVIEKNVTAIRDRKVAERAEADKKRKNK